MEFQPKHHASIFATGPHDYLAQQYLLVLAIHFQASFHINYYSAISLTAVKHFGEVTSHSVCFGKILKKQKSLKVHKH